MYTPTLNVDSFFEFCSVRTACVLCFFRWRSVLHPRWSWKHQRKYHWWLPNRCISWKCWLFRSLSTNYQQGDFPARMLVRSEQCWAYNYVVFLSWCGMSANKQENFCFSVERVQSRFQFARWCGKLDCLKRGFPWGADKDECTWRRSTWPTARYWRLQCAQG